MFKWSSEQESVLNGNGNMLVSANAGSGKTAVMVEKVMRLIENGTDIRRILLMTFTKAAANEMREKLVKKMYESIQKTNNADVRKQLVNLPFAHIDTIDGFCFYLMRKYFNIAGCDPSVVAGESSAMELAENECLDIVLEKFFAENDDEFIKTAEYFRERRSYDKFKKIILKIKEFASTRPSKEEFYDKCVNGDRTETENYYIQHKKLIIPYYIDNIRKLIEDCLAWNFTLTIPNYKEAEQLLLSALSATCAEQFFQSVLRIKMPNKIGQNYVAKGAIDEETADFSKVVSDTIKKYVKESEEEYSLYTQKGESQQFTIRKKLIEVCKALEDEYDGFKKRRNLIDIADATGYTLKILENDEAREEIRGSFDYIFIDEYQDTNYLQEMLLNGISSDNVFSVGDVKQAIYHFRAAEPKIFIDRGATYESGEKGHNYFLNTNYRSCDGILDFTNRICDRVMIKQFCQIDYKGTARLNYGKTVKNVGNESAVKVYVKKKNKTEKVSARGIYSVKEAEIQEDDSYEANFIASKILSVKGTPIEIDGKIRGADFGDMAILLRNGAHFVPIIKALKKYGVPYYSLKDTGLVFPERELIVDCLRIILNADDDIPLYSVCTSPIGGFSTSELVHLRGRDNPECRKKTLWETLNLYKGNPILENKIKTLLDFLENMRTRSAFLTTSEMLDEILAHNLDVYLSAKNPDILRELNAFIIYVSSLGSDGDPAEFIEFYDTFFKGNNPPVKENSVVLMTMHGSKGLEFPIVFLPFQDKQPGGQGMGVELDGDLGMAVKLFFDEDKTVKDSFEAKVLRMKDRDEDRQERARLMYVAFTRAKNYLFVSGEETKVPDNVFDGASVMQWILFAASGDGRIQSIIEEMPEPCEFNETKSEFKEKQFIPQGLDVVYKYENDTQNPAKYSVSEILRKEEGYGYNPFTYDKNTDSITLGVAVHTVMQYIDYSLDSEEKIIDAVDELKKEGKLTEEEAKAVPIKNILRTLKSDLIKDAEKYECKREQPFIMYVPVFGTEEKVLVQGVIDLLIDKGDSFAVVDFKTGLASADKLKERYSKQLELYAEGVEKILHKPVSEKIIYGVMSGIKVVL